jgi:hypothetical protein
LSKRSAWLSDRKRCRSHALQAKRQVFEAFELQVVYNKLERRIEISATVSEAVAEAIENAEALREEGLGCLGNDLSVVTGIAGAGFEPATFGL